MRDAIVGLKKQLQYKPVVINAAKLPRRERIAICGMGGSHLAGNILGRLSEKEVWVWHDYALPPLLMKKGAPREWLVIVSSYSGNTEEVLSSYRAARAKKVPVAAIAKGGKLLQWAQRDGVPYVKLPDMHLEPRLAVGLSFCAIAALTGERSILRNAHVAARTFTPRIFESQGKKIASTLKGKIPLFYGSFSTEPIVRIWKIAMNETTKVPAFWNTIPEMNHNEMTGFDLSPRAKKFSLLFAAVIFRAKNDSPLVKKRMNALQAMYRRKKVQTTIVDLGKGDELRAIFGAIALGYFTALSCASYYGADPMAVPMVEEFKKRIASSNNEQVTSDEDKQPITSNYGGGGGMSHLTNPIGRVE